MLTPGQKLFEYEITRLIGQGGFAAVFEARDRMLNRQVAIKQLLTNKVNDKIIKRFVQEARVAAALEHPNVVTIYALRISEKRIYMIMEYLPGGSLRDLITGQGKLSAERAVHLTVGICEGLARLHAKGIIHRDIKAENILMTADGRPKVTDFGIAHVPEAVGGMAMTRVGFQPGTLLYSSPEQVRGEKLDPRSDVYQVGELLYFMLTGQHYIDLVDLERQALTKTEPNVRHQLRLYMLLEKAICHNMPEGLAALWREVGVLAGVIEKSLAKDKEDRFRNTAEFAAALQAIDVDTTPTPIQASQLTLQDSRAYNKCGMAHFGMQNYEQAIYYYGAAIQLDSRYAEAYNNRSAAHLMLENYDQAVLDCNWALELAPHFVAAYLHRGIAHTGLKSYKQALLDYDKTVELSPKNVYAHYNRGNTYALMDKYAEALDSYSQAIVLYPELVVAYINRGLMNIQLSRFDRAVADYNRAIALNPNHVRAFYHRANAYRALGQYEQALADYSQVIRLNPDHNEAYKNRARTYKAMGDEERAAIDIMRVRAQTSSLVSHSLPLARDILMSATPLDFLNLP